MSRSADGFQELFRAHIEKDVIGRIERDTNVLLAHAGFMAVTVRTVGLDTFALRPADRLADELLGAYSRTRRLMVVLEGI